ncbi:MAG: hypothetical protein PHD03_03735 [Bacilli bacterium]|nr:hypothetical protein [Bacilli bacterium]MDD4407305.1 hypothetical protein [Bacilli bacterium]
MIGVIVPELKYVSYILEKCQCKKIEKNIYKCNYYNNKFLILITGYGKVNIALSTQYLIDNYNIKFIISLGLASCLSCNNINLLDIIIPLEVCELNSNNIYKSNKLLNNRIIQSLKYTNNIYFERKIFTIEEIFPKLPLNVNIIDYDLGIVGKICNNKKIPFTGIKVITFFINCNQVKQYYLYNEKAIMKGNKILLDFLII